VCDRLAIWNSRLVASYLAVDDRARELCLFIKGWAKRRSLCVASQHTLSSYTWVLLAIHHLQNCNPPVVPVLQQPPMLPSTATRRWVRAADGNPIDCSYASHEEPGFSHCVRQALAEPTFEAGFGKAGAFGLAQGGGMGPPAGASAVNNSVTLGELIHGFFVRYEREFRLALDAHRANPAVRNNRIVSVRTGSVRYGLLGSGGGSPSLLPIEDPFEVGRDLGEMITPQTLSGMHTELMHTAETITKAMAAGGDSWSRTTDWM